MKKFLSIAAVLAMITVTAISVSAAEVTPQTEENASTSFSYEYKFDPSYTVTIPSQVTLTTDGTPVEIKAENVANLDGKRYRLLLQVRIISEIRWYFKVKAIKRQSLHFVISLLCLTKVLWKPREVRIRSTV